MGERGWSTHVRESSSTSCRMPSIPKSPPLLSIPFPIPHLLSRALRMASRSACTPSQSPPSSRLASARMYSR